MEVPQKILKKWHTLRSGGDAAKILKAYEEKFGESIHLETIRLATRTGVVSDSLFEIMADFYQKKIEMIKEYM